VYRLVDFARGDACVTGVVQRVEYDPNRSARIALIKGLPGAPLPPSRVSYSACKI
jgi:large subunit ribosomal protein L2